MQPTLSTIDECPIYNIQPIISGKYKLRILWDLRSGTLRYNELKRSLLTGNISSEEVAARTLSRELKHLMSMGFIIRKDYNVVPPKVDYTLTPLGESLVPIIASLHDWGSRHEATK